VFRSYALLVFVAAATDILACESFSTVEPSGADDGDGGVRDIAADAAAARLCPLGCLPPAPGGWTGPSAVFDGPLDQKPTACPTLYTVREVDGYRGFRSEPAVCSCGAPVVTGTTCTVDMITYGSTDCSGSPIATQNHSALSFPCLDSPPSSNGVKFTNTVLANRGSCQYPNPVNVIPSAIENTVVGCGLPQSGACETRTDCVAAPVPQGPYTRVCLHAPGDISCPSFDYPVRFVARERIDDDRSCDFAGCTGAPSGGMCGTSFGTDTSAACPGGGAPMTNGVDSCYPGLAAGNVFNIRGLMPVGIACPSGSATLRGSARPAGAVTTFCCNR
jgi:hypothetical protein